MRRRASRGAVALAALVASAGCGGPSGEGPEADSTLVTALIELHLADARAALDTTADDPGALADSLRQRALAIHGLDSAALADRLDDLAADPALAKATYDAVDSRMALERQGMTPDIGRRMMTGTIDSSLTDAPFPD